jgi:ribonuclease HII
MGRRLAASHTFRPFERDAQTAGYRYIVGIDEAGRGPLAGPVVAAAVILCPGDIPVGLQDSKCLTAHQREAVLPDIHHRALAYGIGIVTPDQIDRHNILWATKQAMMQAIRQLTLEPELLLIDGSQSLPMAVSQQTIVGGDACCASIAAASIVAKVTRDRLMSDYAQHYPLYGFERHKGYPTREHYACLQRYGPCAIHRRSFRGVLPLPCSPQEHQ